MYYLYVVPGLSACCAILSCEQSVPGVPDTPDVRDVRGLHVRVRTAAFILKYF